MMNVKYVVESFYDDAKVTVETNDPEVAILEMIHRDMAGVQVLCVDGFTGEVLAIVNNPSGENYSTQEFALMTLGVLMAHQWGEEEDEPEEVEEDVTAGEMVLAIISALSEE